MRVHLAKKIWTTRRVCEWLSGDEKVGLYVVRLISFATQRMEHDIFYWSKHTNENEYCSCVRKNILYLLNASYV